VLALSKVSQRALWLSSKTASARGIVLHTRHFVPVESMNSRIATVLGPLRKPGSTIGRGWALAEDRTATASRDAVAGAL
jgi:hypothetical protein